MTFDDDLRRLTARDARLAAALAHVGHVPHRTRTPGFAGLVWTVCGQQLSTSAATAIFTRVTTALPALSPAAVAAASDEALRGCGLSAAKVRTLRAVAEAIAAGALRLDTLDAVAAEDAIAELCAIKGIGRWTAEVYLLFACGHPDIFPSGDLALQEGARLALGLEARPDERTLRTLAADWAPHRSAAAHLLWAYYGAVRHAPRAAPATS